MYCSLLLGGPKHGDKISLKYATKFTACEIDGEMHLYELLDKVASHAIYKYAGVEQKELGKPKEV